MVLKYIVLFLIVCKLSYSDKIPIVITTWRFEKAANVAWNTLQSQKIALDAIEAGCAACEEEQCDGTVGYGGSPDEDGETVLDAMLMDGNTMNIGGVISLRRIKNAISVARVVLEHTSHSILAGDKATQFAVQMGFSEETLTTNTSKDIWKKWKDQNCQPNFWQNVIPDPKKNCGPYTLKSAWRSEDSSRTGYNIGEDNHDTIGMIAIDAFGNIAAGTSTNGANHKIPGRVADSAIPGAGAYADKSVGAAAATGDGDVMLRFSPSFLAVEEMRRGNSPLQAAQVAVLRISTHYPSFSGAVIVLDKNGSYGAACHGMVEFPFMVGEPSGGLRVEKVTCESSQIETNDVYTNNTN